MVSITQNELPEARNLLAEFFHTTAPRIAARTLRTRIISRTLRGVDADGTRFVRYNRTYAKYFRKSHGLQTSPVNLYALGPNHMIESQDYYSDLETTAGRGKALAVSREANPRSIGNQSRRHWMGVNSGDAKQVSADILTEYNKLQIGSTLPVIDVRTPF